MGIKYNFSNSAYSLEMAIALSLQRALLSEVSPNLRMVAVDWDNEKMEIQLFFYFDNEVSEENQDSASAVAGEVNGDFDECTDVVEKCIRLDHPERLPSHMRTVYRRKE